VKDTYLNVLEVKRSQDYKLVLRDYYCLHTFLPMQPTYLAEFETRHRGWARRFKCLQCLKISAWNETGIHNR